MSHLVLVIGCHRAGTSATAGCLFRLGVDLGHDAALMPPNHGNPTGYYERVDVVAAHDTLFRAFCSDWEAPFVPVHVMSTAPGRQAIETLTTIVAGLRGPVVGVKDPRATFLVPLWRAVAARAGRALRLIIVTRAHAAMARSLALRERWDLDRSAAVVDRYQAEVDRVLAGPDPRGHVGYGELLVDWRAQLQAAASAAGFPLPGGDDRAIDAFLSGRR